MPDLIQIVYGLFLAGAVYGGIRADIKNMHERIKDAKDTADGAHRRIDLIFDRRAKP